MDDGFFSLSLCPQQPPSCQSRVPRPAPAEGSLRTPPPPLSRPLPPGRLPCAQPARSPFRSGMTLAAPSPRRSRGPGRPHLWLGRPRGLQADPATRPRLRNGGAGRRLPPRPHLPGAAPGAAPAPGKGEAPGSSRRAAAAGGSRGGAGNKGGAARGAASRAIVYKPAATFLPLPPAGTR